MEPNHYLLLYGESDMGRLRVEEHTAQLDKEKAREFQREFKEGKTVIWAGARAKTIAEE